MTQVERENILLDEIMNDFWCFSDKCERNYIYHVLYIKQFIPDGFQAEGMLSQRRSIISFVLFQVNIDYI